MKIYYNEGYSPRRTEDRRREGCQGVILWKMMKSQVDDEAFRKANFWDHGCLGLKLHGKIKL